MVVWMDYGASLDDDDGGGIAKTSAATVWICRDSGSSIGSNATFGAAPTKLYCCNVPRPRY